MATNDSTDPFAAMGAMSPTRALDEWTQMIGLGSPQNGAGSGLGGLPIDPVAAGTAALEMWRAAVNTQFNVAISMLEVMGGSRRR